MRIDLCQQSQLFSRWVSGHAHVFGDMNRETRGFLHLLGRDAGVQRYQTRLVVGAAKIQHAEIGENKTDVRGFFQRQPLARRAGL